MLKGLTSTFRNNCNNIELTYKEYIVIEGQTIPVRAKLNDDCYENGNFVGSFILKTIQFETSNDVKFRNKEFEYYKVVNGESIKIGTFITTEITDNDTTELVKVVGMDYGLKAQVEYRSNLDYSSGNVTLLDVWNECCELSGLESGVDEFENSNFIVDSDQFTGTGATIRDVFIGIALSSGSFIKVMNDDKIYPIFKTHTEDLLEETINTQGTLENVLEIDKIKELKGNTYQQTYTGKNLLKNTNVNSGDYNYWWSYSTFNDTTGEVTRSTTTTSEGYINHRIEGLKSNTTYTISCLAKSNGYVKDMDIYCFNKNTQGIRSRTHIALTTSYQKYSFTFTTASDVDYSENASIRFDNNGSTQSGTEAILTLKDVMLVEGEDTDFEPYVGGTPSPNPDYPQKVVSVTGLQNIDIKGKNLFDTSNLSDTTNLGVSVSFNNSEITLDGTLTSGGNIFLWQNSIITKLKAGTYTFHFETLSGSFSNPNNRDIAFTFYNATGTNIGNVNLRGTRPSITFTLNEEQNVRFGIYANDVLTLNNWKIGFQLEEGSTATDYEPYKGNTYEINLGKNLLNPYLVHNAGYSTTINGITFTINNDGTITANGTATANATFPLWGTWNGTTSYLNLDTNKTYKFSDANGGLMFLRTLTGSTYATHNSLDSNTSVISGKEKVVLFQVQIDNGTTVNNQVFKPMLELGNTATSFSPYFTPIELNKIGDYQDYIRKSTGKNLFDKDNDITTGKTYSNDGSIIDLANGFIQTSYIGVDSSTYYTLSTIKDYHLSVSDFRLQIIEYDENKNFIKRNQGIITTATTSFSVELSSTTKYVRLGGNTDFINELQFEKGTSSSSYEPYGKVWYIEKNIGKVVLDGSETYNKNSNIDSANYNCFYTIIPNMLIETTGAINIVLSNCFLGETFNDRNKDIANMWGNKFASQLYFKVPNTIITTSDLQTWLSTHNTEVYYVLATPTYTEITNQELINQLESIRLLKGTNNISITSEDLTGELKLTYWNNNSELVEDYTELEDKRDTQPISCVRLGMSQIDGENVDMIDEDLVEQYGENWLILNDNPFAYNQEKRQQLIPAIFNKVKGFGYSAFVSKTSFKPYMTCGDTLKFRNRNGDLVDSILLRYSHEYKENDMQIQLQAPSETSAEVKYVYPLTEIDAIKRTQVEVDKDKVQITNLTAQTSTIEDNLSQNYYTKDEANTLVQTAQTGLTNTFSEAGGNNIFRNTGLWFEQRDTETKIGKNLFNINGDFTYGGYTDYPTKNSDGTLTSNANFNNARSAGQLINHLKPNTNYTVSLKMISTTSTSTNKSVVEVLKGLRGSITRLEIVYFTQVGNKTLNFTTPSDTSEIWISISNIGSNCSSTFDKIQLEEGNTATSYEPYYEYTNNYEFWEGPVIKAKEEKASNYSALLLQKGTVSQEQLVPNGNYTVSFKYKKLVQLAEVKCIINDIEIQLDSTTEKEVLQVLEVNAQHINVQFISDTANSCEIYDLMVNAGSVKLAYSQNQNETTTDTVNISKGITITSSDIDVTFKANADGIRTLDKYGNRKTEFTDTGMITTRATIEEEAEIVGLLHKRVGNHIWVNKI